MRNILKRSERNSRSRRPNRGVSAVAASLASAALVAGLASYPVGAQDGTLAPASSVQPPTETSASPESTTTVTETVTQQHLPTHSAVTVPEPAIPSSSAAPLPKVLPGPVNVTRKGDIDHIIIEDPDGEAWGYGTKASLEDIFGITRSGNGEIEEILKVVIDGEELEPQYFGFVNNFDGGVLAFDLDALNEIPPRHVEFEIRTTGSASYAIAKSEEVPTAKELNAQSTYGKTDSAAATVNPDGVGMARAATLPASKYRLKLGALSYGSISAGSPPRGTLKTEILGTKTQKDIQLTELVITHNNASAKYSLSGPITIRKNGGTESCTVPQSAVKTLGTRTRSNGGSVNKISVDLTGCPRNIVVWEGDRNTIDVDFNGPGTGNPNGDYTMELYGMSDPVTLMPGNPTQPKNFYQLPNDRRYDACTYSDGLLETKTWWDYVPEAGFKVDVIEVRTGISDLGSKINVSDPRLALRVGSDASGWTELRHGDDYTLSVNGGSLYFVLNESQIRVTRDQHSYDFVARVPISAQPGPCGLFMWENAPQWYNQYASPLALNVPETPREQLTWLPAAAPNPTIAEEKCSSKKIALVFDTSDSVFSAPGGVQASRDAGLSAIETLRGTNSQVAIYNFASDAGSIPDMSTDLMSMNRETDVEQLRNAVKAIDTAASRIGAGGTNFEAGLAQVPSGQFDVVYFITDGLPTTSSRDYPTPGLDVGLLVNQTDLVRAVEQANRLKESGTRIETVMVGYKPFNEHILKDDYFHLPIVNTRPSDWPLQEGFGYPATYGSGESVLENLSNGGKIVTWSTPNKSDATEYNITNQPEIWRAAVRNTRSMGEDISSKDAVTTLESFDQLADVLRNLVGQGCYSINLSKVDFEDRAQSLSGYSFDLVNSDAQDKPVYVFTETQLKVSNLVAGKRYRIIETKAPAGFSLLTRPIGFTTFRDDDGKLQLQIEGGKEQHPELEIEVAADEVGFTFKVANVRQGNLPKTGGAGLQLPILFGGVLIAAGVLMGNRKATA